MMHEPGEHAILVHGAFRERPSLEWQGGAGACCSQGWRGGAGGAAGAWSGTPSGVGACSGRESDGAEAGGGGKPCLAAAKLSRRRLPWLLIPAANPPTAWVEKKAPGAYSSCKAWHVTRA